MTANNSLESPESILDAAFEKRLSRYVVGIDLGTTNCAVAFMDTQRKITEIEVFQVEQMVDFQTSQKSDTLPSFHYELSPNEAAQVDPKFQFVDGSHKSVVGIFARQRGMQLPGRCIASAKSWLCHKLVDRTSDLLPWNSDDDVKMISPVQASRRYLEHIRKMWDREHPKDLLADQDVVVTIPASFDEVARQLTIQAAFEAKIPNAILIEEPQAAFYAWLHRNRDSWMDTMRVGQTILVCDIGGGTTDFTLIRVVQGTQAPQSTHLGGSKSFDDEADLSASVNQSLQNVYGLHRVAVGEHLMLGGDNLDLALARSLELRLLKDMPGVDQLHPRQWDALKAQCRVAKESLLGPSPPETYMMTLPGTGAKLIGNTRSLPIEYTWAKELLVDGFFGQVALNERPQEGESGFQEFGLPFASEPNAHRHLAKFLWEHRWAGRTDEDRGKFNDLTAAKPDWVLFNGGVLESSQIQEAIMTQLRSWFAVDGESSTTGVLHGNRLDLAVAQGAAYFGLVRRGEGVRIDARLAQAYYLLVERTPPKAICIMPANAMPLDRFRLDDHPFDLTIGQPVQFPIYNSSTNLVHSVAEIVSVDEQSMTPMPPIRTVLEGENRKLQTTVPVVVETELTEIGTLAMNLKQIAVTSGDSVVETLASWKLEFDVRALSASDTGYESDTTSLQATSHSTLIDSMLVAMELVFGESSTIQPSNVLGALAEQIGCNRREWNPTVLRAMWKFLTDHPEYRKRSSEHEARWINLLGWCLRPGFGMAADDWRVATTWRLVHNKLVHRTASSASEAVVLWRRIAGGFSEGQQLALFQDCWPRIRSTLEGGIASQALSTNMATELLRLIGSLERLNSESKTKTAKAILEALKKKKLEPLHGSLLWALGRIGSRRPVYATLQQVVNASHVHSWIEKLLALGPSFHERNREPLSLCLMQLALRTHDRYRDHSLALRQQVIELLERLGAPKLHVDLIANGGSLDNASAESIVGDSLPLGFRLRS